MDLFTLDDEVRPQDSHRGNADTRFGRSVGCAEASEDDGGRTPHGAEERLGKLAKMA